MADPTDVVDNTARHRLELHVEGQLAHLDYEESAGRLTLVHTEVPEALGGRGLGGLLVQAGLAKAIAEGLAVVPQCAYAKSWLDKHPDAAATVDLG
jgi:uncharacterized protein